MKCPVCGEEMRKGYIQSARAVFFTEVPHRYSFKPKKEEVILTENNFLAPTAEGYICLNCKKAVIDYAGE